MSTRALSRADYLYLFYAEGHSAVLNNARQMASMIASLGAEAVRKEVYTGGRTAYRGAGGRFVSPTAVQSGARPLAPDVIDYSQLGRAEQARARQIGNKLVRSLAGIASQSLGEHAPRSTGRLKKALTTVVYDDSMPNEIGAGVAPLDMLEKLPPAPRGTIKEFLADLSAAGRKNVYVRRPDFQNRLAWWYLTTAQKEELEQARLRGQYGGDEVIAYYWLLQEQGTYPHPEGAGAGAQLFIEKTTRELEEQLPNLVGNANADIMTNIAQITAQEFAAAPTIPPIHVHITVTL